MNSILFLTISILFFSFANFLRFARWNMLCNSGHLYQSKLDFHTYFVGRILNLLLPLKLGDTIRLFSVKRRQLVLPTLLVLGIERCLDAIFFLILASVLYIKIQIDGLTLAFVFTIVLVLISLFSFLRIHLANYSIFRLSLWTLKRIVSRKVAIKSIFYSISITFCIYFATVILSRSAKVESNSFSLLNDQISVKLSFPALKISILFYAILISCLIPSIVVILIPNLFQLKKNWNYRNLHQVNITEIAHFEIRNRRRFAKISIRSNENIVKVFQGGSNAITYLTLGSNGFRVRKSARDNGMETLLSQFKYMQSFGEIPAIPRVELDQNTNDYFGYGLKYYEEFQTLSEYLNSRSDPSLAFLRLRSNYEEIFTRTLGGDNANLDIYFKVKFERLNDLINSNFDGYFVDSIRYRLFKEDIMFVRDSILKKVAVERLSRSHGDFSASNILFDETSFVYIDLLAPNQHSTVESDWGKLSLSLLIELEERIHLQSIGFEEESIAKLSADGIHLFNILQETLSVFYDCRNISHHVLLHFVRVIPYRVSNPESAKYWFELFHESIAFLRQKHQF